LRQVRRRRLGDRCRRAIVEHGSVDRSRQASPDRADRSVSATARCH